METNEIASAENIRKIKELLQTVDNQSQLLIQATQREDARGIVRFTDDHKISTKATPECKVEDSKRKQSVLQGVEEVERLKSEIADLKTSVKEKDLLIANLRAEAIKASKLYNALLAKKAEVEAQNLRLVKRLDVSSEQEFDSSIDYTRVMELKSAVLALEAELQAARTSEESLKTELLCISNDFARTKEDLAEVESQYSRLIEEISVAGDGETGSIPAKFPATQRIGSVKQFPVISGAEEEVRTARESRSLPISPLSTATSNSLLAKSPNKLSRQLRTLPRDSTLSKTGDSSGKESESLEAKRRSEESLTLSSFSFASVSKHGSFPITALTTLIRARAKMLLLCDMSATMGTGGRIKAQRKCVYTIMQTCIEQNCCFALGTWNSRVSWLENSSQGMVEGHGWWRRGDEVLNDFKALDAVEPEGGHDMRASLEAAIRAYPDTTDLVVICHGKVPLA